MKAGDRILFGKYSGSEVKIEGEEHMILREDDILGVLEESTRVRQHQVTLSIQLTRKSISN